MAVYYASKLYTEFLEIYLDEYKAPANAEKRDLDNKYDQNYDVWFENKESTDTAKGGEESAIYHLFHHQDVMKKKEKDEKC